MVSLPSFNILFIGRIFLIVSICFGIKYFIHREDSKRPTNHDILLKVQTICTAIGVFLELLGWNLPK